MPTLSSFLSTNFRGPRGIQGIQGLQGIQGIQGLQGVQGTQGTQGNQGTQGTQGTQGLLGTAGDPVNVSQITKTASYTLVSTDGGKHISTNSEVIVPADVFSIGDVVSVFNDSISTITITQGASVTLRQSGSANTGNRTLSSFGLCTILCVSTNTFVISGTILT
jgi:hypothetical protein